MEPVTCSRPGTSVGGVEDGTGADPESGAAAGGGAQAPVPAATPRRNARTASGLGVPDGHSLGFTNSIGRHGTGSTGPGSTRVSLSRVQNWRGISATAIQGSGAAAWRWVLLRSSSAWSG